MKNIEHPTINDWRAKFRVFLSSLTLANALLFAQDSGAPSLAQAQNPPPDNPHKIFLPTIEGNKEVTIIKHTVTTADEVLQKLAELATAPKEENTINQIILLPTEGQNPYVFNQSLVIPEGVWLVGDIDGSKDNLPITFDDLQASSAIEIKTGGGVERLNISIVGGSKINHAISATGVPESGSNNNAEIVRVEIHPSDESTVSGAMIDVKNFLNIEIANIHATNARGTVLDIDNVVSGTLTDINITTEKDPDDYSSVENVVGQPVFKLFDSDGFVINGLRVKGFANGVLVTGTRPTEIRAGGIGFRLPINVVVEFLIKNTTTGKNKIADSYEDRTQVDAIVDAVGEIVVERGSFAVRLTEGSSPFPSTGKVTAVPIEDGLTATIELRYNPTEVSKQHVDGTIEELKKMGFRVVTRRITPGLIDN